MSKAAVGPVVVIALAAVAVFLPGPAPARAVTNAQFELFGGVTGGSGCHLYAHAHNYYIQVYCGTAEHQDWDYTNPSHYNFPGYGSEPVNELQLAGTSECVNLGPNGINFYLDSCQAGDAYEEFWVYPTDSNGDYWFISAQGSSGNALEYMTATAFSNYANVDADLAGNGGRAIWYPFCC